MRARYDALAALYDAAAPLGDALIGRSALVDLRVQLRAHVRPASTVLDIGAGSGRSMAVLLREGWARRWWSS